MILRDIITEAVLEESAGVLIVSSSTGKILLGKRTGNPGAGMWNVFGGLVDSGEDHLTAASREVSEEIKVNGVSESELASRIKKELKGFAGGGPFTTRRKVERQISKKSSKTEKRSRRYYTFLWVLPDESLFDGAVPNHEHSAIAWVSLREAKGLPLYPALETMLNDKKVISTIESVVDLQTDDFDIDGGQVDLAGNQTDGSPRKQAKGRQRPKKKKKLDVSGIGKPTAHQSIGELRNELKTNGYSQKTKMGDPNSRLSEVWTSGNNTVKISWDPCWKQYAAWCMSKGNGGKYKYLPKIREIRNHGFKVPGAKGPVYSVVMENLSDNTSRWKKEIIAYKRSEIDNTMKTKRVSISMEWVLRHIRSFIDNSTTDQGLKLVPEQKKLIEAALDKRWPGFRSLLAETIKKWESAWKGHCNFDFTGRGATGLMVRRDGTIVLADPVYPLSESVDADGDVLLEYYPSRGIRNPRTASPIVPKDPSSEDAYDFARKKKKRHWAALSRQEKERLMKGYQLNFDVNQVWYHGSKSGGFTKFESKYLNKGSMYGAGIYLATDPMVTVGYGKRCIPMFVRIANKVLDGLDRVNLGSREKRIINHYLKSYGGQTQTGAGIALSNGSFRWTGHTGASLTGDLSTALGHDHARRCMLDLGYDALYFKNYAHGHGEVLIVYDTANVRHVNAKFSISNSGSKDIMA